MPVADLPFETASWGRRVVALLVDYAACWGVMLLIYGGDWFGNGSVPSIYLNLLFVAESALLIALVRRLVRSARDPAAGGPDRRQRPAVSLLRALLRQVLIILVIPPLVFRPDGRGLHDLVAGSATVPLQVPVKRWPQRPRRSTPSHGSSLRAGPATLLNLPGCAPRTSPGLSGPHVAAHALHRMVGTGPLGIGTAGARRRSP